MAQLITTTVLFFHPKINSRGLPSLMRELLTWRQLIKTLNEALKKYKSIKRTQVTLGSLQKTSSYKTIVRWIKQLVIIINESTQSFVIISRECKRTNAEITLKKKRTEISCRPTHSLPCQQQNKNSRPSPNIASSPTIWSLLDLYVSASQELKSIE